MGIECQEEQTVTEEPGLTLGDLMPNTTFVFKSQNRAANIGAYIAKPILLTDEGKYVYLESGVSYSVTDIPNTLTRPVLIIDCALAWKLTN